MARLLRLSVLGAALTIAAAEPASAEAGAQSSLKRDAVPPQPEASGASERRTTVEGFWYGLSKRSWQFS